MIMKPHFPNPFKPSKLNIISMVVSKLTTFLNHNSLTFKQINQLHSLILINGLNFLEPILITQIINTQSSNHSKPNFQYLQSLLHQSKHPNIVSRTSAIQFFYQNGKFQEILDEYLNIRKLGLVPTISVVSYAIKACAKIRNRICGITIHSQVYRYGFCGDVHLGTALFGFYSKFDDMENAKKVFDEMSERNSVSFLIDTCLESGNLSMAERVFSEMGNEDVGCWNSMVSWYAKIGDMEKAIATFGPMPDKDSGSWNAMIGGYVDLGKMEIARNFYDVMPEENVDSCIKMVGGYSRNGDVESARQVFDEMGEKNRVLYNVMIDCYAKNGRLKDALQLFDEMLQPNVNIQPDNVTLATVISVCCQLGDLRFGSWVNDTLMKQMGIVMDDCLRVLLIDLYMKFGLIDKAYELFHGLKKKDVGVYTTMILACSRNGWIRDAIKLFSEMLEAKICPNLVTFSGLLNALNYMGRVQESDQCFYSANPLPPEIPLNHKSWVPESYSGASPLPYSRPSNHMGWVQENVGSTNPNHMKLSNHMGWVQENAGSTDPNHMRPSNHRGWVQENAGSTDPNHMRPSNHRGWVQENAGSTDPNHMRPSNHRGWVQENAGSTDPNHMGWVQENAGSTDPNHMGWVQENAGSTNPNHMRPSNHMGWVQENADSTNPNHMGWVQESVGSTNPNYMRPSNHFGSTQESGSPLTHARPLNHHLGWVQQTYHYHGVNYTSPLVPLNHMGVVEQDYHGFNSTSQYTTTTTANKIIWNT